MQTPLPLWPARLDHLRIDAADVPATAAFDRDALGFVPSDPVEEGANRAGTACFPRSDPGHHSLAVLRAPAARPDRHCYEASCWNGLRDRADHHARHRATIWWGPGWMRS